MKIKSIELENYRQYKNQKIKLCTDASKNFTIIVGRNGFGKSNLLNAVTWCFYGVEDHLKAAGDEGTSEDMPIINIKTLNDIKNGTETSVRVSIHLEENNGEACVITRTLRAGRHSNGDKYIDETSKLEVMSMTDGRSWDAALNPTYYVNGLIPKDIRQFFFFDGEKLRQHFEKDTNKKIKEAINEVSQTNLLDKAIERLNYLSDQFRRETRALNPKTQEYFEKMEGRKQLIQGAKEKLTQIDSDLEEAQENENRIKTELKGCNVGLIERYQKERDDQEASKVGYEDKKNKLKERIMNYLLKIAPYLLLKQPVLQTTIIIEQMRKKGLVPPPIDETYIRKILKDGTCICGGDISKGENRKRVQDILQIARFSKLPTQEGETVFSTIRNEISNFISMINELRKDLIESEEKIATASKKIQELSELIGKSNIETIRILEADRIRYEGAIRDLIMQKAQYDLEKRRFEQELMEVTKDYDKEISKENRNRDIIAKKERCDNALRLLEQIKSKLITNIRLNIQTDTEKCFFSLIKEKRETYKKVLIDEDYNIKIVHKDGFNALNTLSAGETQIFVLSFAAALRNASGFHVPLIIDTPLGKIDEEYRRYVSSILPKFLEKTQVVMLVTSSEYTPEVRKNLASQVAKESEFKLEFYKDDEETKVIPLWK